MSSHLILHSDPHFEVAKLTPLSVYHKSTMPTALFFFRIVMRTTNPKRAPGPTSTASAGGKR